MSRPCKPKVILLAGPKDPQRIVAAAAKLCYSNAEILSLYDGLDEEKSADFVKMLSSIGHESPMEHISFTFGIEGVSRSLLAQFTRHRIASYSVKSQRYVLEKDFSYVVPPEIEKDAEAAAIYSQAMEQLGNLYEAVGDRLAAHHEARLKAQGMEESKARKQARKQANEDARYLLPNACETKMVVTMNARSLFNFFHHRLCNRAQWEIRAVAEQMFCLVYQLAPEVFSKSGPPCVEGGCPEGAMSCGRQQEMRAYYQQLKKRLLEGEPQ